MKQISSNITGSFILNGVDLTTTIGSSSIWSGSFSTRITSLESFSSSLDATFATDAQLSAATSSLNQYTGSNNTNISNLNSTTASLNSYTASNNTNIGNINSTTSSLNSYTGSNNTNIANLNAVSASLNTFTGSAASRLSSIESTTSSLNLASGSAITRLGALEVTSGSNITRISALETASGSAITRLSSIESTTGSLNAASGSAITRLSALEVTSGSNITRISALEVASGSAITRLSSIESTTGSLNAASGSAITRLNALEITSGSNITRLSSLESKTGSYATTGSNTFVDTQYVSASNNATGFTTTASLYTDGGFRVAKDAYISGTLYLNNLTVFGTQSVAYISSSQLNIGTNIISVNTDTPSVRFGGLAVYDSGSTGLTGSILWDSQNNHWVYSNPSGSSYSGGMFISGPRTSTLGSETGTTACMLLAGQGGDHLTSSMIYHSSTVTCFHGNSFVSSSGAACFNGNVTAASVITTGMSGNVISIQGNETLDSPFGITWTTPTYTGGLAAIRVARRGATDASDMMFYTSPNGDIPAERLRITSTGVSCFSGTVCATTGAALGNIVSYSYGAVRGYVGDTDGNCNMQVRAECALAIKTGGNNQRAVITNTGLMGVGATSPSSILNIQDTSCCTLLTITNCYVAGGSSDYCGMAGVVFQQFGSFGGAAIRNAGRILSIRECNYSTDGLANSSLIFYTATGNTDTARLTIDSLGNSCFSTAVGIGGPVLSSSYALTVWGCAVMYRNCDFVFHQPNGYTNGIVWKNTGYAKDSAAIRPISTGAYAIQGLGFYTGDFGDNTSAPVLRLGISPAGNSYFTCPVGINIATPSGILDVRAHPINSCLATLRIGTQCQGGSGDEFANLEFYWGDPDAAEVKAKIFTKNTGNVGPGGGGAASLIFATRTANAGLCNRFSIDSDGISTFCCQVCVGGNIAAIGYGNRIYIGDVDTNRLDVLGGSGLGRLFNGSATVIQSNGCVILDTIGSARLTIASTGIATFACQVCMPVLLATGCIGIGTTSPQAILSVEQDYTTTAEFGSQGQFSISGKTNSNKRLSFGFNTATDVGFIQAMVNGTSYNGLLLNTRGGNVGIGTTNLGERLNIGCGGAVAWQNTCNCQKWHIQYRGTEDGLNFVESAVADFRLFLKAGGNVGVSIGSPQARLDVLSTLNVQATGNSDVPYINFSNNGRSFDWGRVGGLLQGDGDGALYFSTKLGGGVTEKLRITSAGVSCFSSTICTPNLRVGSSSGITTTGNLFWNSGDGVDWYIQGQANGPTIRMKYDGGSTNRSGALGWVDNGGGRYEALSWQDSTVYFCGTSGFFSPKGTTAERPSAACGWFRFNTDLRLFEGSGADNWGSLGVQERIIMNNYDPYTTTSQALCIRDNADGGGTTWTFNGSGIFGVTNSSGGHSGQWGPLIYMTPGAWRWRWTAIPTICDGSIHGNTPAAAYKCTIQVSFTINGVSTGDIKYDTCIFKDNMHVGGLSTPTYVSTAGCYTVSFSTNGYEGVRKIWFKELVLEKLR